ncbi:MAG: HAD-IIA family hydrolase [Firmicutes bacterium]|nr:HAD-IIA family hydrolase [Bacillota bacterium]
MDGTIYLGDRLINGAKEFIDLLREQNKKFLFMTNNSSKSAMEYKIKLNRLGIEVEEKDIFTSGEATCIYIDNNSTKKNVYLLGTEELEQEFIRYGFNIVNNRSIAPDFVVLGFDTDLNYKKLWKACDYIREGMPFIATHPDINCPLEGGKFMPDCGAMIEMIKASTGVEPKIIGKPNQEIIEGIFQKTGLTKEELCIVGDRLYTDIATGINSEVNTVLVLSGETKQGDLDKSPIGPDLVVNSIADIYNTIK